MCCNNFGNARLVLMQNMQFKQTGASDDDTFALCSAAAVPTDPLIG